MRSRKALNNLLASVFLQVTSIISGLIVPNIIIQNYGSDVNGLINSITQFLSYITLLESGVGGVTRAALYKPLAQKNVSEISKIIKSSESFFKKIGIVFIFYLGILGILLPYIIKSDFSNIYIISLILIIGISTFFQYYFGITYQLLLQADQKQYIILILQSVTIIANVFVVIILVYFDFPIFAIQLISSLVFVLRPLILKMYVSKNYKFSTKVLNENDEDPLKQRWAGLGHHLANTVHNNTDNAIISIFLGVSEVSVYSIYYLIISGIKKIAVTIFTGVESAFGDMIARKEKDTLNYNFNLFETLTFMIVSILFFSAGILLLPFVNIYTSNINDANYMRPVFGWLLLIAEGIYCLRIPYHTIVVASGHFKQTRNGAFREAFINIIISLILIPSMGITGVAIGTLCSMMYRTLEYVYYLNKNIMYRSLSYFLKKLFMLILSLILILFFNSLISHNFILENYFQWIFYALFQTMLSSIAVIISALVIVKEDVMGLKKIIVRLVNSMFLKNKKRKNM